MVKSGTLLPLCIVVVTVLVSAEVITVCGQNGRELVPAMFIFGDSLIDNGNNNNLPSFAKANYFPYGIDFNGGPTGRFSNGYTMVDEIGPSLFLILLFFLSPSSLLYIHSSCLLFLHGYLYSIVALTEIPTQLLHPPTLDTHVTLLQLIKLQLIGYFLPLLFL